MQVHRAIRRAAVMGAVALAAALGAPGVAAAQAPGADSVTGVADPSLGGDFSLRYAFAATSGPSGERPAGSVLVTGISHLIGFPDRVLSDAPVTCLAVAGHRATIGVDLVNADGGPGYGFGLIFVEDGAGAVADRFAFAVVPAAATVCPLEPTVALQPIEQGDIVVHDAHAALPVVKAQCKRGGWAAFGFASRRACDRFVRLRPRTGPFPTAAAQCRDGGWAAFGFRSESRCLRFVAVVP
jgi:hypothetical protein